MGKIHDQINAIAAERDGLIAARSLGLLYGQESGREQITGKTRQIRAIRNQAAASLGVPKSFTLTKFGKTFRVDLFKRNALLDARGLYHIYAQATCLDTGKVHVWNGAKKERLQCPNMPTSIRTDRVIGTDADGNPIYEVIEDVPGAVLAHLKHAAQLGITEEEATDATPEWGSTTTTAYGDDDAVVGRSLGIGSGVSWTTLLDGAGTLLDTTTDAFTYLSFLQADNVTDKWRHVYEYVIWMPTSSIGDDDISSATYSYYQNETADTFTGGINMALKLAEWTPANAYPTITTDDYGQLGSTEFASLALSSTTDDAYNDLSLNASGIAAINGSGRTALGITSNYALSRTPPTWEAFGQARCRGQGVDTSGTTQDPKLTVEHTAAAASGASVASKILLGLI